MAYERRTNQRHSRAPTHGSKPDPNQPARQEAERKEKEIEDESTGT